MLAEGGRDGLCVCGSCIPASTLEEQALVEGGRDGLCVCGVEAGMQEPHTHYSNSTCT